LLTIRTSEVASGGVGAMTNKAAFWKAARTRILSLVPCIRTQNIARQSPSQNKQSSHVEGVNLKEAISQLAPSLFRKSQLKLSMLPRVRKDDLIVVHAVSEQRLPEYTF
jgi:hypothetical protein